MRFRKTINICKGLKVNLSKSGVSCTVGGRGLSLNVGKNGVFLNTSIPGTGLYDRRKIAGGSSAARRTEMDVSDYDLALDERGKVVILRKDGRAAGEEELRRLRRTDWYAAQSAALLEELREQMEAETDAFVNLYRRARPVRPRGAIESARAVEERIDRWLDELELPVEFSVQYDYDEARGSLMLDLDLPEIEDLPDEKPVELASGAIKPSAKTQRELRDEYRTCVLGLAVFFASHMFAASAGIGDVLISGYTQRRDRRTGEREDCYVFSIAFDREAFADDRCSREDPMSFCEAFRSRINPLASGELKQIEPYTPEEFAEIIQKSR